MIRVLIVDDSALMRQLLTCILESDKEIEVVGQAADGAEGVELTSQLAPDVITMDVHMPRMDGSTATKEIMARFPTPIVVVTSISQSEFLFRGFDILRAGALEIVQKPSATAPEGMCAISAELIAKIKAVAQVKLQKALS